MNDERFDELARALRALATTPVSRWQMLKALAGLSLGFFLSSSRSRAQMATKPNIVFVLTDDQHIYHLKHMPYLSSKPHGNWMEFTNAFENTPLCCPTRATVLTGQYSHHHGIKGQSSIKFKDTSTIATWLKSAGYRTGLVGKYLNGYPTPTQPANYIPPGWDYWVANQNGVGYYNYNLTENGRFRYTCRGTPKSQSLSMK